MSTVSNRFQMPGWKMPSRKVRPIVAFWIFIVIIVCFSLVVGTQRAASLNQRQSGSQQILHATSGNQITPANTSLAGTSTESQQQPSTLSHPPEQAPNCSPYAGGLVPSAINLANSPDGLSKQVDNPVTYKIYGASAATLRTQIRQCAPKSSENSAAIFTAQTVYKLTWQYSYVNTGNDSCRVTHAKVGIHVMQIMPNWQVSPAAPTGLRTQWESFMGSLTTHEDGHTAIDVQYAQTLLDDLNNFPAISCSQLAESVRHLTDSDVATLNQANDNYDSNTNHGATQGAILP